MIAENFLIAEIRREQLLDLLTGRAPTVRAISHDRAIELAPRKGALLLVWNELPETSGRPLPQVIVGERSTLDDLVAWSSAYLVGLGPLTAQTRLLTTNEFHAVLQRSEPRLKWKMAGGAAGVVIGEVLMRAHRDISVSNVSVAACLSTLSYVLLRAHLLGMPISSFRDLSERWEYVRRLTGQDSAGGSVDRVLEVASVLAAEDQPEELQNIEATSLRELFHLFRSEAHPSDEIVRRLESAFGIIVPSQILEGRTTVEEKVKAFDFIASEILLGKRPGPPGEKEFALAYFASLCRRGLAQRVSLVASHRFASQGVMLWLGGMQIADPVAEALSVGDGLGWRLAREMLSPEDVFSPPSGDIEVSEMRIFFSSHVQGRGMKAFDRSRLLVELAPGVTTLAKLTEALSGDQQRLDLGEPKQVAGETAEEAIRGAERVLQNALQRLRALHPPAGNAGGARYGGRSKRR